MCTNHDYFMQLAADEAAKNNQTNEGGPFGACIVKEGELVVSAHNLVLATNDPTAHAEVSAIRAACAKLGTHDLSGCTLYTSCYPCPMCLSATIWANIKVVYYGNLATDADAIGFRDDFIYDFIEGQAVDTTVLQLSPLGRDKTIVAFNEFANKQDKTIY